MNVGTLKGIPIIIYFAHILKKSYLKIFTKLSFHLFVYSFVYLFAYMLVYCFFGLDIGSN